MVHTKRLKLKKNIYHDPFPTDIWFSNEPSPTVNSLIPQQDVGEKSIPGLENQTPMGMGPIWLHIEPPT